MFVFNKKILDCDEYIQSALNRANDNNGGIGEKLLCGVKMSNVRLATKGKEIVR